MNKLITTILFWIALSPLMAQEVANHALSLEQAIEYALLHNQNLLNAQLDVVSAEGMVKVALDTHESREAAYKEQRTRNVKWAKHINKMLEKIAPREADGVCHRTVDCEDCQGLTDEDKCKQKLGIWVPKVSVMKEANKEATKDKTELNKQVSIYPRMLIPLPST